MNFLLFGIFLVEFCSASRCGREKDRIKKLSQQKRELRIERNELKEENEELKRKLEAMQVKEEFEILDLRVARRSPLDSCYADYREQLLFEKETTKTTTEISTTTTTTTIAEISTKMTRTTIEPNVTILVIPQYVYSSYLQSGDGSSRISAMINAPQNGGRSDAAFALVNGKLHIFGGTSDGFKIERLDGCSLKKIPARLNEERDFGHAAVSVENGRKALVCFAGKKKSCEIFDGSASAPTFAAELTHRSGGLGLYKHQPATVGCGYAKHQKAETLSATGWTALPDFPLKISHHSLVGLENGAMLLLGGHNWGSYNYQTGIWQLKEDQWSRIGELSQRAYYGSAIYVSRSVYYFECQNRGIHRVDLDENEELEGVEEIGSQPAEYCNPVLFQTDYDHCT